MRRFKAQPGIALFMTMAIIFVVLTSLVIGLAIILNNLDRARLQSTAAQAQVATDAGIERVRGLYRNNLAFFDTCSIDDCVNFDDPENASCVACGDTKATYLNPAFRYKARIISFLPNAAGVSLTVTGYTGSAVSSQPASVEFNP